MSEPRTTVICIFYNAERFFSEAIESVLAQEGIEFELLLVDDGSTDESTVMAREYERRNPERVRYLEHPAHANRGMSETRNLGLSKARGEYVAFIDSDDRWRAGKLAEQAAILDADPTIGMVCGTVNYWSRWNGGKDRLIPTGRPVDGFSTPPRTTLALYPLGSADAPCPSDVMVRRSLIEQVGGFEGHFTGPRQMYEDQGFFAKIYLASNVHFSSRVWLDYRQHEDSCVSKVVRDGQYADVREYFLDWFEGYIEGRCFEGKAAIERALRRARWRLAHPALTRLGKRIRRITDRVLQVS